MNYYDIEIFEYLKKLNNDFSFLTFDNLKNNQDTTIFKDIEDILSNTDKTIYRDDLEKDIYRVGKSMKRNIDEIEYLSNHVIELLKLPQPEQRSPGWFAMRETMITASDWAGAIGKNPYASRNKTLLRKLGYEGEKFTGNAATRWGTKYEQVATDIYELRENVSVIEFGCIPHPNISFLGASPDGITKDGVMLEIKCPPKRKITGIPPIYYWIQVQGQLEVCDLERCDFLECKLGEYDCDEDYFDDIQIVDGRILSKTYGMELGMTLKFKKGDSLHFEYSKIGISLEESNGWISSKIMELKKDKYTFSGSTCWYLEKISCVPIFRDREWFKISLEKLESFWNDWQSYKKNGYEILLKNKRSKPKDGNKMIETDLKQYEGFFKKENYENDNDDKNFSKLNLGFIEGVPIQSFAFSNSNEEIPCTYSDEDSTETETETETDNKIVKHFLFSDFNKTKEKTTNSNVIKASSKFMFS